MTVTILWEFFFNVFSSEESFWFTFDLTMLSFSFRNNQKSDGIKLSLVGVQ